MKWNIPNTFSMLRAVLAPLFFVLILSKEPTAIFLAVCVFIAAAFTDYLDGWTARMLKEVSAWGVFFDPLADKVLTATAFIAFAVLDFIPWWMVAIVLFRDVFMTLLRIYADSVAQPVVTSRSAKLKTFLQMSYIIFVLVMYMLANLNFHVVLRDLAILALNPIIVYVGMLVITAITFWTGIEYFFDNRPLIMRLCRRGAKA